MIPEKASKLLLGLLGLSVVLLMTIVGVTCSVLLVRPQIVHHFVHHVEKVTRATCVLAVLLPVALELGMCVQEDL